MTDSLELGGKAASLFRLKENGFRVASGFVIKTGAFEDFLAMNRLSDAYVRVSSKEYSKDKEKKLRERFLTVDIPEKIEEEIMRAVDEHKLFKSHLIVRSSATVEDGGEFSFAGLFDSVPCKNLKLLPNAIKRVYSSLFNSRAVAYMQRRNININKVKMAVIVQEQIKTDFFGVVFTSDPISGAKDRIVLEAFEGMVPDSPNGQRSLPAIFYVKKNLLKRMIKLKGKDIDVNKKRLSGLAKEAARIENVFANKMDIEWGLFKDYIYIFQARPITILNEDERKKNCPVLEPGLSTLYGTPASCGITSGKVRIIKSVDDIFKKLKKGEIIVARQTTCSYYDNINALLKAKGIVTQLGGLMTHEAILAREHGMPCVTGVNDVTKILKNGDSITIDGALGVVYYKGDVKQRALPPESEDIVFEKFVPIRLSESGKISKIKRNEFVMEPSRFLLTRDFGQLVAVYVPKERKLNKVEVMALESYFKKELLFPKDIDKITEYGAYGYMIRSNRKFKLLYSRMLSAIKSGKPEKIKQFIDFCMKECLIHMHSAERILSKMPSLQVAVDSIEELDDSARYYGTAVWLLSCGYGPAYIRREYRSLEPYMMLSFAEFLNIIDNDDKSSLDRALKLLEPNIKLVKKCKDLATIYKHLSRCKFYAHTITNHDHRKELAATAMQIFKGETGKDLIEFVDYGSMARFDAFVDELRVKNKLE